MPPKPRASFALFTGFLAVLVPILASAYLAWMESYTTEKTLSLTYAQDVLRRAEKASSQFDDARKQVAHANFPPCSPDDIKLLRQVDLGSSYIKATGRVAHDALLCTSQGASIPLSLGKPDLITDQGVSEYFNKHLSSQQSHPLNIFAAGGFAVIFDPGVAVDVSTEGQDVELAVFVPSAPDHNPIATLGHDFPAGWFDPIPQGAQSTNLDSGYLVSSVRSAKWDIAVLAATPQSYIYQGIGHFALIFVPIGILCGAVLGFMVNLLSRMHTSFPAMLRRAIKDKNFYVLYQPVVELATQRVIGAEALVRWRSDYADIRPDYFIPQAEECGLIQLITAQVISMVARDLHHFLEIDPDFHVAINVSAADLCDARTIDAFDGLLRASGARPANFEVEATERAFLQGPETSKIIDELRARGFSVAIDDFGTGYSSLACLQTLSLDTLKIDKAFVDTINTDGATSQVVPHIIEMAHSLHLDIVAEGVENEPQAQYLVKRGVHYAQGWHFGRPMDTGHLCEEIRNHMPYQQPVFDAPQTEPADVLYPIMSPLLPQAPR
ncbi:MAG: EAL domain-containing protein [Terracidiphilus sp.]|jgi:sensor c-di-GMP phosphodiesterase-like protein